ncbi:hypothetical protein ACHSBP_21385 [Pseudoalteromonas sp. XMcav1-K]|uniref:hypothetical protein n=1 Tax=Pseudoalteromonas sp. XMcav1-K TaxID=3374372 RepID=UPI003757532D
MKKPLITLSLALYFVLLTACSSTSDQNKNQEIAQTFRLNQGIEVRLSVPQGFKLTQEHYGFIQPESFSRIKISEVEIPYQTYLTQLTPENFLKNQLQLMKSEIVEVNGAKCSLLTFKQVISGTYYEKLWLIAGDKLSSIKIEASYPEGSSMNHKAAIKKSLFSTAVKTDNSSRLYTGLPFYFKDTSGFKLVQRNLNSVVFISNKIKGATVVLSHGKLAKPIDNIEQLSNHFLSNSNSISDPEIISNNQIKIDSIPALATQAYALHQSNQSWVYQITSFQKNKFLVVQALSKKPERVEFIQELEQLIEQFKFK